MFTLEKEKEFLDRTIAFKIKKSQSPRWKPDPPKYLESATGLLGSTKNMHMNSLMTSDKKSFGDVIKLLRKGFKLRQLKSFD